MKCHIEILATVENWNLVFKFLHKFISKITVDGKLKSEILISAEEIFVNVAKYAYIYLRGLVLGDDFPKQKGYVYFQEFIPIISLAVIS